jgi:L-threonylcarbamoyladenylate synthase
MTDAPTIEAAAVAARGGKLVVFPTDTVYGVGARPDDPGATAAVFEAKGRHRRLTLPVLVASAGGGRGGAVFDGRAARLAAAHWPGSLTIVLPRTERSRGWHLGGGGASVGVRVPNDEMALELLRQTGPLAVTSANRSGEPPGRDRDELVAIFGDRVAVYLTSSGSIRGAASTVVDLTGPVPTILRRGELDPQDILDLVR